MYLPFIESGYNPMAYSPAGAGGMWQFMPYTGKRYGLSLDRWVDERRDPLKASEAAANYLSTLHGMFNDWSLALASYNAGEGKIGRAIAITGSSDFFHLHRTNDMLDEKMKLKDETLAYVPRFIAMAAVARNAEALGFPPVPETSSQEFDHVAVPNGADLKELARACELDWECFQSYNPGFRKDIAPPKGLCKVALPEDKLDEAQAYLASAEVLDKAKKTAAIAEQTGGADVTTHIVKRGETLSIIAQKHKVSIAALKKANKGKLSKHLQIGQRVNVPVFAKGLLAVAARDDSSRSPKSAKTSAAKAASNSLLRCMNPLPQGRQGRNHVGHRPALWRRPEDAHAGQRPERPTGSARRAESAHSRRRSQG